jgi:caffeoyl-CoA O-methyltransferase
MFHQIPKAMADRMQYLEQTDSGDREDGTPRIGRLRQIPRETGKFIAMLASGAPDQACLEIGTSAGYSTLWLALACQNTNRKIVTFEILERKALLARETFRVAEIGHLVELVVGDARHHLPGYHDVGFCFLDAEKEVYADCYEMVVPNLVSGGLLVADNAINHREALQPMLDKALYDERVDSLVVPMGKGLLVSRKL